MYSFGRKTWGGAVLAAALVLAGAPSASAGPAKADGEAPGAKAAGTGRDAGPAPAAVADPAFDRYVDLGLLGRAWSDMDPALLTDLGLQLAEGERVLMRPHKGITADQLLSVAARVAAEKRDEATLARLAKAADALGKTALAEQVGSARKLASASRAVDPAATVSIDGTSVEAFTTYKDLMTRITAAKLANDAKALDRIAKTAVRADGLTEEQRQHVVKAAAEAKEALPKDAAPDAAVSALKRLAAASRGDPLSYEFDSRYKVNGQTINAHIVLNGDGTGSYSTDDGSNGDLTVQFHGGGNNGPYGPKKPSYYTGRWSLGDSGGTFKWSLYANDAAFTGSYHTDGGGFGPWNGQRTSDGGDGGGGGDDSGNGGPVSP